MRTKALVATLVGVFVASLATAQESQLQYVNELHINPGKTAQFEAANANRNERMSGAGVTFGTRITVSDGLPAVYREVTPGLGNMAALATRQAQLDTMPTDEANAARAREAIAYIESSIRRSRPDLSYVPGNPRVPIGQVTFIREANLYLRFGTAGEAAEIIEAVGALFEENNVGNGFFVNSRVTGSGPDIRIAIPGRNAADSFAENQRVTELLGEEYQALAARLGALCRRLEWVNRTIRRDLWYQPSN